MSTESLALPVVLLSLALVQACSATYEDVSADDPYAKYVGQVCTTTRDLQAQGVAVNYERSRGTEYVSVSMPLATRSYTTFAVMLSAGSKFKVLGARQCQNCPLDEVVKLRVNFEVAPIEFQGMPVYLTTTDRSTFDQVATCAG